MTWSKKEMALEVIKYFKNGESVNLGIGLPTIVAENIPNDLDVIIHSENGVLGVKGRPKKNQVSPTLINAGKETISVRAGASFFDSSLSFGMIRGGHIDHCVLGGMEVDQEGSLANWMIPGKLVKGMGGAMDLVAGVRRVIVIMDHTNKAGESKLLKECSLPLTGKKVVNRIITNLGVLDVVDGGLELVALADGVTREQLDQATEAHIVN